MGADVEEAWSRAECLGMGGGQGVRVDGPWPGRHLCNGRGWEWSDQSGSGSQRLQDTGATGGTNCGVFRGKLSL